MFFSESTNSPLVELYECWSNNRTYREEDASDDDTQSGVDQQEQESESVAGKKEENKSGTRKGWVFEFFNPVSKEYSDCQYEYWQKKKERHNGFHD